MLERINFPKVVTVLAVTFGIALGACGLTALASARFGGALLPLAMLELAVMLLSAAGLVLTTIVWVVASALGTFGHNSSESIRLFEKETDEKRREPRDEE